MVKKKRNKFPQKTNFIFKNFTGNMNNSSFNHRKHDAKTTTTTLFDSNLKRLREKPNYLIIIF